MKRTAGFLSLWIAVATVNVFGDAGTHPASQKTMICPVSGDPIDAEVTMRYKGASLGFCSEECRRQFRLETSQHAARANQQLLASGQARQVKCPLTGKSHSDDWATEISGEKIAFCCEACRDKVAQASPGEQVKRVFENKSFVRGFKVDQKQKSGAVKSAKTEAKSKPHRRTAKAASRSGEPPVIDEKAVVQAIAIQERHARGLMERDGVRGTAIGADARGRPVIIIYITSPEEQDRLPLEIEGVPVQPEVIETFSPLVPADEESGGETGAKPGLTLEPMLEGDPTATSTESFTSWLNRPVPIGVSTGNSGQCQSGTIACRLKDDAGNYYALSNNHIFAMVNQAALESVVVQPGRSDTSCQFIADNQIGKLFVYKQIFFGGVDNVMDAALIRTTSEQVGRVTPSDGYGTPRAALCAPKLGQVLRKYGRTTGMTEGTVTAVNAIIDVTYPLGTATFIRQIVVTGEDFAKPGDSGSLLVQKSDNRPVGLMFCQVGTNMAVANPIYDILKEFRKTIPSLSIDGLEPEAGAVTATDHLSDLRNWHELGLPLAAQWNAGGFTFQWHVNQIAAGRRFLPSVSFPMSEAGSSDSVSNNATFVAKALTLTDASWALLRDNNLPVCLRTNNITNSLTSLRYRLPINFASIPASPLVWTLNAGTLRDERLMDNFGPISNWSKEGKWWSEFLLTRTLTQKLPSPAYVVLIENNEGCYRRDLLRWATPTTQLTPEGLPTLVWKSPAELETLHLRLRDYLQANPAVTAEQFHLTYWQQRGSQYRAAYNAFKSGLPAGWRDKVVTVGYNAMHPSKKASPARHFAELGYDPELTYYDAGSEEIYSLGTQLTDFTSLAHAKILNLIPAWEYARSKNPKLHRELILHLSDGAVLSGAKSGLHEVMTPARYQAFCEWLLWSIREPGVPTLLRHWCSSSLKPGSLWMASTLHADCDLYGAPELKTASAEDFARPLMNAVDRAAGNTVLREFWLKGRPVLAEGVHPAKQFRSNSRVMYPQAGMPDNRWRVLECSTNPPRSTWGSNYLTAVKMKVWAVATRIDDRVLLYAWSPCKLTGKVAVTVPGFGVIQIDVPQPSGYWLIKLGATTATRVDVTG